MLSLSLWRRGDLLLLLETFVNDWIHTRRCIYTRSRGKTRPAIRSFTFQQQQREKERERPTGLAIHLRQRLKFERKKWRRKRKPWLIIIQSPFRCKGSGEEEKLSIFAQFPLSRSVGMWFYLVAKVNRRSCCCNDRCTSGMRLASLQCRVGLVDFIPQSRDDGQ